MKEGTSVAEVQDDKQEFRDNETRTGRQPYNCE
jgi:hypothetical protein